MRMLCVARHPYLSEHLCRYFDGLGMDTIPCVGLGDATARLAAGDIDMVICDYDLLTGLAPDALAACLHMEHVPVIAVSLTRHPADASGLEGIAGFLYLPTLQPEDAHRVIAGARRNRGITPPTVLQWPGPTSAPQLR